jgi:hypothetical protein
MAFLKFRGNTTTPTKPASTTAANAPLSNVDIDGNFASINDSKIEIGTNSSTPGFLAGDILYASANNILSRLAKGSNGQVLKLSNGIPSWAADNDTTYTVSNGTLAVSISGTAATSGTALAWGTTSGFSANSASNTTYDLRVGPALTALATLMNTAGAGFIRRGATANTYTIDTSTYSTTAHGHFIGTTAVQSSAANQALTGITGLSTPNSTTTSAGINIQSGLGTAASSNSGSIDIFTGSTNGVAANGASSGSVRLSTGGSGTNGGAGNITLEPGLTFGASSNTGVIYLIGGNSNNSTFSNNGHIYIRAGSALAATGTKSGGKVFIDGGRPAAGGTIVDDGEVHIGTEFGTAGSSGTAVVNIGNNSSTTNIRGTVVLSGNLTVNGITTTINSSTIAIDDKNIELGSVAAVTGLVATLATGTAVVTLTTGTTSGLIPGQALTKTSGTGVFGASPVISTINSLTQFTVSVNHATAGSITFSIGGITDATANGGGITLKGATDKTITWLSSTGHWTSNVNLSAPALVSTIATGTAPLTVTSTTRVANLNVATAGTADNATNTTNVALTTASTSSAFKVPFANTTVSTTGNYGLLQDSEATFTYNPSTNTLTVGTVSGALLGNASSVTNGVYTTGDQSIAGIKTFTGKIHLTGDPQAVGFNGSTGIFEIGDPSGNTPATMSFHKQGYAINMGLDTDNIFRLGGWSQGANTYRWTSDTSGNFTATGNVTAYSDFRLKKDLEVIQNALSKVEQLTGYTYTRIDSGERQTGILAQDALKVIPEVVNSNGEYMSVAYGNMVGLLIEAIKELNFKVEDLQNQLMKK